MTIIWSDYLVVCNLLGRDHLQSFTLDCVDFFTWLSLTRSGSRGYSLRDSFRVPSYPNQGC